MRPELCDALRALAATLNQGAAVGRLPADLIQPTYAVMAALDLPDNEAPLSAVIRVMPDDG